MPAARRLRQVLANRTRTLLQILPNPGHPVILVGPMSCPNKRGYLKYLGYRKLRTRSASCADYPLIAQANANKRKALLGKYRARMFQPALAAK